MTLTEECHPVRTPVLYLRGEGSKVASYLQQTLCVGRKKEGKKESNKSRCIRNTRRNPQQPGGRDRLETARDETRPAC